MNKIKVAWICEVSNQEIRSHIHLHNTKYYWKNVIKKILGRKNLLNYFDRGVWNTLAIREIEKIPAVDLHVITPMNEMKRNYESFILNGVHYHVINIHRKTRLNQGVVFDSNAPELLQVRKYVAKVIDEIQPDIINMIGAENPEYAVCVRDINTAKYPFLLSMQTALSDPSFQELYPIDETSYQYRSSLEQEVFKAAQYIGTDAKWYHEIASRFNMKAELLRFHLCSEQNFASINTSVNKEFDFVYYAMDISKGGEDAVRAFCLAYKKQPSLTLNVIGKYAPDYYENLMSILKQNGCENNVIFSGFFNTHEEALQQMVKSRCALITAKVDIISGTVREPMALGVPVVTYITKGTPSLNKEAQTVLLAPIGDYEKLADNMLRLINDKYLQEELVLNARRFADKYWDSSKGVQLDVNIYKAILDHYHRGISIPKELKEAIY